jgi:hypothetical protein
MDEKELDNFFVSRGVGSSCPICNEDEWAPVFENGREMRIVARSPDNRIDLGIGVMLRVCLNCGFVAAHSKDVISGRTQQGH